VTAPALIVVGVLMARSVVNIDWGDVTEAVPAFLTLALMPATFSISHGLAAGFVSHAGDEARGRSHPRIALARIRARVALRVAATSGSADPAPSNKSRGLTSL
jgi:xanthine/uracil/vitamin C permease (AzgA family)